MFRRNPFKKNVRDYLFRFLFICSLLWIFQGLLLIDMTYATGDPPVAVDDSYAVDEGGLLYPAAPGLLANDTDAEGDSLTAELVSPPTFASAFTMNADGSFS